MAKQVSIEEKLKNYSVYKNIAIQGEIVGPGKHGNKYKLNKLHFYVFSIFDIKLQKYFSYGQKKLFCLDYGFFLTPIVHEWVSFDNFITVNRIIKMSKGKSLLHETHREGLVFRSITHDDISFKAIDPEFLLKHNE